MVDDGARALRTLLLVAGEQDGVVTRRDRDALGLAPHVARRLERRGAWVPLLRGSHLVEPSRSGRDRTRSWARSASLTVPGAVAGLTTAASLHHLAGVRPFDGAQVLLPPRLSKRPREHLDPHAAELEPHDVVDLGGIAATSVPRTLADLVPLLGRLDGLAVLDSALASGALDAAGAVRARRLAAGRRGSLAVADLWDLADGRAESPLESRARLRCLDAGLAPDELQVVVRDAHGRLIGRADMGFRRRRPRPDQRTRQGWLLLEADGRDVHSTPDALYRDRWRANALVAEGHDLVRCTWADTLSPTRIPAMVWAAL